MIAIVDYGVGNLFSLVSSLKYLGEDVLVTSDKTEIERADKIILPGVGAFGDAYKKLEDSGLIPVIMKECGGICKSDKDVDEKGFSKGSKPLLGICLGMQLLFEKSYEYGEHKGLGLIDGEVVPFVLPKDMKVPHMGWNSLQFKKDSPIFKYINEEDYVYYVHSYYARGCESSIIATSEYGISVTSAVQKGNIFGCQFHPEKSGEVGLDILKGFCELK